MSRLPSLIRIHRMTSFRLLAALALATAAPFPGPALAGPGHDHGHDHAAPAVTGPALPRFAAESELFELVGVLEGRQLTLYLDRAADNAPVAGAQIELEIDGAKLTPQARDEVYELTLPAAPKPGVLPVTATVTAGTDIDLLAGELEIRDEALADEAAHAHGVQEFAAWIAGGIVALLALAALIGVGRRRARTGAAA